ncbi:MULTISPECIES: branched-chain amino acid ABC transporter permease [Microbacterium]|uniref:Branched-chain amino acid ABC transporter permease n=1 Tax=Microbacterium sufflavum TaxID=2851649 RepID=A0ABY4IHA1_9MICO|nr:MULTISPECIES: branched-chain amino acid ABC transporter permease [Microbacterium]MBN6190569.1 branched-chain amino acid ABC transporter permease [Aneurinibacillus sp. BA2021]MCK2026569.1 branched-chain amino acid ABC transporter permease [Microbacterium sufflavum]UPL11361.1 branched-chain amino acid ABC transporter permease [Microbacterium sufflavum]
MDFGSIFGNTASYLFSPTTIAYALAATGLAVHFGYTGLLNFGMAAFMAIGGYGYAISILTFGFPWWAGVLVGVLGGALFALLLGIPTLRLRADYLAIATIAAAEVVRLMFVTELFKDWTNSAGGLSGYHQSFRDANPFPTGTYGFGPWTYNATDLWVRVVGLIALALAVLVVWALMRSPWGRVLKGIREDEDAVRSLGKNVFAYKMQALVVGGIIGALGGIVFILPSAVIPGSYSTSLTFFLWTILLLGGAATVLGPTLGAVLFWIVFAFLGALLPAMANAGYLPMSGAQADVVRYILIGIVLMLIVIFRPQGILGNKREMTFVK